MIREEVPSQLVDQSIRILMKKLRIKKKREGVTLHWSRGRPSSLQAYWNNPIHYRTRRIF